MWRIGIECKMQQLWGGGAGGGGGVLYRCEEYAWLLQAIWLGGGRGGVFYRCEEYAWLLQAIWLHAYFSHTWEILVWNPWRIGTNSSRREIYEMWNLRFNTAILFNYAEPFEQIDDTPSTEGPMGKWWKLVKLFQRRIRLNITRFYIGI